jgi:hypothetical protein
MGQAARNDTRNQVTYRTRRSLHRDDGAPTTATGLADVVGLSGDQGVIARLRRGEGILHRLNLPHGLRPHRRGSTAMARWMFRVAPAQVIAFLELLVVASLRPVQLDGRLRWRAVRWVFGSRASWGEWCGCSPRTVTRIVGELVERGVILRARVHDGVDEGASAYRPGPVLLRYLATGTWTEDPETTVSTLGDGTVVVTVPAVSDPLDTDDSVPLDESPAATESDPPACGRLNGAAPRRGLTRPIGAVVLALLARPEAPEGDSRDVPPRGLAAPPPTVPPLADRRPFSPELQAETAAELHRLQLQLFGPPARPAPPPAEQRALPLGGDT